MRSFARVVAWVVGIGLGLVLLLPGGLYGYGLSLVPRDRSAIQGEPVPDRATAVLWASLGGEGEPSLSSLNPCSAVWSIGLRLRPGADITPEAGERLGSLAARVILGRGTRIRGGMSGWHVAHASTSIWARQNWSAREASAAFLTAADYGHGLRGLAAAARGYFGHAPEALTDTELAMLVARALSGRRRDPWCFPESNGAEARRAVRRLGGEDSPSAPRLLAVPRGACVG